MSLQKIQRAVAGGYIQADMTGTGCFEVGRITRFDADKIWFESAMTGEEVWVQRRAAFKATRGEYELALHNAAREAETSGNPEDVIDTLPEKPESAPMMGDDDVDGLDEEEHESRSIVPKHYKDEYVKVKVGKHYTQDSGDELAIMLRGKSLDETYEFAAQALDVVLADLYAKYEHLNPGQQRMVLGNRIRRAMKG